MKKTILVLLLLICIGCGCMPTAFAQVPLTGIEGSYVLDDLDGSTIAGKPFDVKDYPLSNTTQTKVLSLWEHKFNKDSNKQSEYGLYLYVYNPTGYGVQEVGSRLSIATKYSGDKAMDYSHYNLKLLSCSTGEYKNLFLKYKVLFVDDVLKRVNGQTTRRYDIAELEVRYSNFDLPVEVAGKSEAFDVGNTYVYTGYLAGYGSDEDTLKCTTKDIDVLALDVKSAWWRYNNGIHTVSQITTAYFGVPDEMFDKYGYIKSIKANWFETYLQPMTVFTDSLYYALFDPYVGKLLKSYSNYGTHKGVLGGEDIPLDYYLFSLFHKDFNTETFNWGYNWKRDYHRGYSLEYEAQKLMLNFYSPVGSVVSSNDVLKQIQSYTDKFGGDLLIGKYSEELFREKVDEGRQYGWQGLDGKGIEIEADSKFTIAGFDVGDDFNRWFWKLFKNVDELPTSEIKPIDYLQDEDFDGDKETIAAKLYIDESEIDTLKKTYSENKALGKKTVLFRFAVTEYSTDELEVCSYKSAFDNKIVGYLAQETAFLDFDIIWLKFVKDNVETVIPVAQKPVDVVGGLTPTPGTDPENNLWSKWEWPDWLKWSIILIAACLVLGLLGFFVKPVGTVLFYAAKGLFYIVTAPIQLLIFAFRKPKEGKEPKEKSK